jgi:L-alanine-DL-glutamate epimerase-like enolase superfamily enzyme
MASIHFGLSIHDFLTSEAAMTGAGGGVLAHAVVPPVVKGGLAAPPEAPGLGVELNEDVYRKIQSGRGGANQPADWV